MTKRKVIKRQMQKRQMQKNLTENNPIKKRHKLWKRNLKWIFQNCQIPSKDFNLNQKKIKKKLLKNYQNQLISKPWEIKPEIWAKNAEVEWKICKNNWKIIRKPDKCVSNSFWNSKLNSHAWDAWHQIKLKSLSILMVN